MSIMKKSYNQYIKYCNFVIDVPASNLSRTTSVNYFQMEIGTPYNLVDISHCYWQIAYRIGMINQKTYEKYIQEEHHKLLRNMALTCVLAPKVVTYYNKQIEIVNTIEEDTSLYRAVYRKICQTSFELMSNLAKLCEDDFLYYNTDGIAIPTRNLQKVMQFLKDNDFIFTVTQCQKTDLRKNDKIEMSKFKVAN
jgi:hypothetical protein